MEDLIREVGINRESIHFVNVQNWKESRSKMVFESDVQFKNLQSAVFTPIDMTDYEEDFTGWKEFPGALPINRSQWLEHRREEPWPQLDALASIETKENPDRYGTSSTMMGMIIDHHTVPEPEEEDFYGKEEDDEYGDDYGEEGEEGEGGEEEYGGDYGDYGEEEEEWPPKTEAARIADADRYFSAGDSLRGKYSEVEIE